MTTNNPNSGITVVSTNDFHPDDNLIANARFRRIKQSFRAYAATRSNSAHVVNETVLLGELPNLIYLNLGIVKIKDAFYLMVGNQQYRFLVDYNTWYWTGVNDEPYPRERLYEEVMEFINDYAE